MATQADANSFADNPVNFMKYNLITTHGTQPREQAIVTVGLDNVRQGALGVAYGRRRNALKVKVDARRFELRLASQNNPLLANTPKFQAVWSGYIVGGGSTAKLPAAGGPNIMLTPELTGCAIVARVNDDGSAAFSHYNLVENGATLPRDQMDWIASAQYGANRTVFSKEDYREQNVNAFQKKCNVVGFRRHGVWEFWGQMQEGKASGLQLREVRKLA